MAVITATPDISGLNNEIKEEFLKLRSETQEYTDEADKIFINFFKKKLSKYKEILYVISPKELFKLKERNLTSIEINKIKERCKGYALINNKLVLEKDLNKNLEKNNQILIETKRESTNNIINGSCAFPGKIKGKVKIVFELDQLKKVNKGDILVTPMTTPDYLLAMKKASAFVTDEGGITCHAAIVAREIGKPCIIGTKIATKILKDNDKVEVDADKGTIKILKKN
ncbi:hypothetical protein J4216_06095 [Candidatus Woesearchaeota archaeon]|nr:hypothetical protein [Candidatus Woesearchaeota archaeon]